MIIAVIDDELMQINSLRRVLTILVPDAEIVEILINENSNENYPINVDVVFCDYSLPYDLHEKIFDFIRLNSPTAIRVTITGLKSVNVLGETIENSQFTLSRPFKSEDLSSILFTVERINELNLSSDFYDVLHKFDTCSQFPEILVRLRQIINKENFGLKDIVDTISHDPVLSSKIISISNSAYLGFNRTTNSLPEAVNRLGVRQIEVICIYNLIHQKKFPQKIHAAIEKIGEKAFDSASLSRSLAKKNGFSLSQQDNIYTYTFMTFLGDIFLTIADIDNVQCEISYGDFDFLGLKNAISAYILTLWSFDDITIKFALECENPLFFHHDEVLVESMLLIRLARSKIADGQFPLAINAYKNSEGKSLVLI